MSSSQAVSSVRHKIIFGHDDELGLNGAVLSQHRFEVLGTVLLTHLGSRAKNFGVTVELFRRQQTGFIGLDTCVLLEELATLMREPLSVEWLRDIRKIYHAFRKQAELSDDMSIDIA